MAKILLPAVVNPPKFRKDGSVSLTFDTRELVAEEIMTLLGLKHTEGWLTFSPNPDEIEIPDERAELDEKSPSERLRNVMFVWYKQETEAGRFVGLFETFRKERMEKIIEGVKSKLDK